MIDHFIFVEKANHQVWMLCKVLQVPSSSYYDWANRSFGLGVDSFIVHLVHEIDELGNGVELFAAFSRDFGL